MPFPDSTVPYLGAATRFAPLSEKTSEEILHDFLDAASNPKQDARALIPALGKSVAECLDVLMESGAPDDFELLMNCAAGSGGVAQYAQKLLATCMANAQANASSLDRGHWIRSMAQDLICMGKKQIANALAEFLLMAGTVFTDETADSSAVPPVVRNAILDFDKSEWKPQWWVLQPPGKEGSFSLSTVQQIKTKEFDKMPAQAKLFKVEDDGACMYRACLATLHLKDARWMGKGAPKDEILSKLQELKWDVVIKESIDTAYAEISAFMPPSDAVAEAFSPPGRLFDLTIASKDFDLYSPVGIAKILPPAPGEVSLEDQDFFEILANRIAHIFLEQSTATLVTDPAADRQQGAWLVLSDAHYTVLATKEFFS